MIYIGLMLPTGSTRTTHKRTAARIHEQPSVYCPCSSTAGSSFQNCFFKIETGKALTTGLAGLALTMTTLPKTSLLPAFVAGFKRVLTMHKPGTTNFPARFTSFAAISARLLIAFVHSDFLISVASESAWARAPLVMGFKPAFIAFMGAMIGLSWLQRWMD